MSSWIGDVMKATSEAESPRSFIYWSALTAISALVGKRIYLDKHYYKLYPNIYTLLNAESGARKGFPVWLAKKIVLESCDTIRVISGRNSIEGIISDLSKTKSIEDKSKMITDAQAFIVSGEFDTLLLDNDKAFSILTDLYNTHENETWENTLKGSGKEILKNVCITLLGASNDENLKAAIPQQAIGGGFLGRMLMIPDDGSGVDNSLTKAPEQLFDVQKLLLYPKILAQAKGEFQWTQDGQEAYDEWYYPFRKNKVKDKTGTFNRLHDQVLKVAMLLSLSHGLSLTLTREHIEESIEKCTEFAHKTKFLGEGVGKAQHGEQIMIAMKAVLAAPFYSINRRKLLQENVSNFDSLELTRILDTLIDMKAVVLDRVNGETMVRATEDAVSRYKGGVKKNADTKE